MSGLKSAGRSRSIQRARHRACRPRTRDVRSTICKAPKRPFRLAQWWQPRRARRNVFDDITATLPAGFNGRVNVPVALSPDPKANVPSCKSISSKVPLSAQARVINLGGVGGGTIKDVNIVSFDDRTTARQQDDQPSSSKRRCTFCSSGRRTMMCMSCPHRWNLLFWANRGTIWWMTHRIHFRLKRLRWRAASLPIFRDLERLCPSDVCFEQFRRVSILRRHLHVRQTQPRCGRQLGNYQSALGVTGDAHY